MLRYALGTDARVSAHPGKTRIISELDVVDGGMSMPWPVASLAKRVQAACVTIVQRLACSIWPLESCWMSENEPTIAGLGSRMPAVLNANQPGLPVAAGR